ncbi:mucosal addressin cell adhesion molecule 1 isoform X2 [Struthio camelus]|uniref:mucosal addressin cell adhesion molecule 1 isoform X2 n=1 Tax=Struthio camelus TaxID=8801 RepID=UPI003603DD2E
MGLAAREQPQPSPSRPRGRREGRREVKPAARCCPAPEERPPQAMETVLLVLLGWLWGCSGRPANELVVVPPEPVVPYGGSVQLNCSLACPEGTVQWRGLDTNLGSVVSFAGHSVLRVSDAVVAAEGTKICQGTCGGRRYQRTVDLKVYSLPDTLQLAAQPAALAPGQPATLRCAARRVYPLAGLALAWYRGDRLLRQADFDVEETEEELFDIAATLPLAGDDVAAGAEFRCEVTLTVRRETFARVAAVAVSDAVTEQPAAAAAAPETPPSSAATTGSPSTATSEAAAALPSVRDATTAWTATSWEPGDGATSDWAAATENPSTASPAPPDPATGSPTARPATSVVPGSGTASPAAGSTAQAQGPAADSTGHHRGSPTTGPAAGTAPACSLRIWSLPPSGTRGRALRIECQAQCGENVTVRWLSTPVALSQYREEAAGSGSTLSLDHAELQHQGRYQCAVLSRRAPVASLQLAVSADTFSTDPTIAVGTTVSLLGLIVTAVTSRCLWKRLKSQYDLS